MQRPLTSATPHAARGVAPLATLPEDVLTQVLRGVSAAALTQCARACKVLRRHADSEALWRRLYCFRWGAFKGGESKVPSARFWKVCVHRMHLFITGAAQVAEVPMLFLHELY